ncbi:DNA-directed DNA polymerase [Tanacetum coccineum]
MTPTKGMEAIKELSAHSLSWYNEGNIETKNKELQTVLNQINNFENNMNIITKEVRMVQHKYETLMEGIISNLEETLNNFIKESRIRQKERRIAKIIQDRKTGSLPSSTETNPRGLANAITTRSRLNYKPPKNPIENIATLQEKLATKDTTIKSSEKGPDNPKKSVESYDHSIPFPGRLKMKKEKEQFRKKGKTEETSKITLNERCSAVLLNKIPFKEKDPGSFTIPCVIGKMGIEKRLADFGASISLMPYSMYARLDLGELKPTRMCIELANNTTQYPRGIAENVIVKIDKFIFPVDFVVLDMKDHKIPIILRRPFLATTHAMIDVFNKKISFEVGNETIKFNIEKSMKFSTPKDEECLSIDMILSLSSLLLTLKKKESLLKVLTQHKAALAWKVADIKGISPSFCTHKILMEDNFKPVVRNLSEDNPKVQDVVKAEIVKLLDSGLIYAISDSPWVSPIHVVPKKGEGITVITNKNNELVPTRTVTGWRVCIDYRKLNDATRKDHFPLPFIDQMLERLSGNEYYCFLDGFSGYFQIPLAPEDQEKNNFTCPTEHLHIGECPSGYAMLRPHFKNV